MTEMSKQKIEKDFVEADHNKKKSQNVCACIYAYREYSHTHAYTYNERDQDAWRKRPAHLAKETDKTDLHV